MSVMAPQFNGRVVAGRYQLGPRRGSGVDAAVFDAFDLVDQRVVAIKVVHPDLSCGEGFERAFRVAAEHGASIRHPNIAEIYDWGADQWNQRKAMYVVVEHLGGGSLREYLDRGRTLSPSQALVVGLDTCKALDVIHRQGLVHGDIRPSTLVFGDDERLRVWVHIQRRQREWDAKEKEMVTHQLVKQIGPAGAASILDLSVRDIEKLVQVYDLAQRFTVFARAERVGKNELFQEDEPLAGRVFTVGKLTLGGVHDFADTGIGRFSVGASFSLYNIPEDLKPVYGSNPASWLIFLRWKTQ